jgi:hypothetical protein
MPEYTGPHDYFNRDYVREWAKIANTRRPVRIEFFDLFAGELAGFRKARISWTSAAVRAFSPNTFSKVRRCLLLTKSIELNFGQPRFGSGTALAPVRRPAGYWTSVVVVNRG